MKMSATFIAQKAKLDLVIWHNSEKLVLLGTPDRALLPALILSVVLVVPVAAVTYRWIEKPAMDAGPTRLRDRRACVWLHQAGTLAACDNGAARRAQSTAGVTRPVVPCANTNFSDADGGGEDRGFDGVSNTAATLPSPGGRTGSGRWLGGGIIKCRKQPHAQIRSVDGTAT